MSFISNILQYLGIKSKTAEFADTDLLDTDETPSTPALSSPEPTKAVEPDPEMLGHILDQVLALFNEAMPGFMQRSVDPEAQRREFFLALDQGAKNYMMALHAAVQARCEAIWASERDRIVAEADSLRKRAQELESKRADLKDKQLSADRQKRALSERVHDLEEKVMKLEAEKEQLDLECKCMVNKTKMVSVLEAEIEDMRAAAAAGAAAPDSHAIDELNKKLAEATADNEALRKALDEAKMKDEMSQAMQADFQKRAAEAQLQIKANDDTMQKAASDLALSQARVDDLQKELAQLSAHTADLEKKVAEQDERLANSISQEQVDEITAQISLFEQVKAKMDAHIHKLTDSLKASQADNETLRNTIKTNLQTQATTEHELQQRIDVLATQLAEKEAALAAQQAEKAAAPKVYQHKSKAAKEAEPEAGSSDVDDLLMGADWLVSTPPKEQSMRAAEDTDFGYQPPVRKPKPTNDAQLSLF